MRMRRFALTIGIVLIMAGILLMSEGVETLVPIADVFGLTSHLKTQTPLMAPTLVATAPMNYTWLSVQLDGGVPITGTFQVGSGGEIDFYIMDEGNFSSWQAGYPAAVLLAALSASQDNFTLSPPRAGSYYFVFENQDMTRRVVVFTLDLVGETVLIHPAVEYLPYGLVTVGILLFALGLRGGRKRAPEPSEVVAAGWICRTCGSENPPEQAFCEKCGRSRQ